MRIVFSALGSFIIAALFCAATAAEVTAVNTLMRGTVIGPGDINVVAQNHEHSEAVRQQFVGMQTSRTVYAGHTLTLANVEPPLLVKRNRMVTLSYKMGGLTITTYGRALSEGAQGDIVDIMNVDSKVRVKGIVAGPDRVIVQ